ncbi:hypothetical protein BABINDRAFT_160836 [Babjeviella inositovora NRRL Y-12698]|uniref:PH domain-containing protein n=1 Tax=Babjeviella inositovora NRRL Y-12698 TaxID=984486 RepID=A0A1E3QSU2_9ASCO|nr:uncharacterized protein BABINDRAFT_160836 [Babjeviella inositovora NRRL Y-12698]ODQ80574.1 hypothetical protein BABINDRAFT_160836 [Babjeviella inositovora NRRL Y-12698]
MSSVMVKAESHGSISNIFKHENESVDLLLREIHLDSPNNNLHNFNLLDSQASDSDECNNSREVQPLQFTKPKPAFDSESIFYVKTGNEPSERLSRLNSAVRGPRALVLNANTVLHPGTLDCIPPRSPNRASSRLEDDDLSSQGPERIPARSPERKPSGPRPDISEPLPGTSKVSSEASKLLPSVSVHSELAASPKLSDLEGEPADPPFGEPISIDPSSYEEATSADSSETLADKSPSRSPSKSILKSSISFSPSKKSVVFEQSPPEVMEYEHYETTRSDSGSEAFIHDSEAFRHEDLDAQLRLIERENPITSPAWNHVHHPELDFDYTNEIGDVTENTDMGSPPPLPVRKSSLPDACDVSQALLQVKSESDDELIKQEEDNFLFKQDFIKQESGNSDFIKRENDFIKHENDENNVAKRAEYAFQSTPKQEYDVAEEVIKMKSVMTLEDKLSALQVSNVGGSFNDLLENNIRGLSPDRGPPSPRVAKSYYNDLLLDGMKKDLKFRSESQLDLARHLEKEEGSVPDLLLNFESAASSVPPKMFQRITSGTSRASSMSSVQSLKELERVLITKNNVFLSKPVVLKDNNKGISPENIDTSFDFGRVYENPSVSGSEEFQDSFEYVRELSPEDYHSLSPPPEIYRTLSPERPTATNSPISQGPEIKSFKEKLASFEQTKNNKVPAPVLQKKAVKSHLNDDSRDVLGPKKHAIVIGFPKSWPQSGIPSVVPSAPSRPPSIPPPSLASPSVSSPSRASPSVLPFLSSSIPPSVPLPEASVPARDVSGMLFPDSHDADQEDNEEVTNPVYDSMLTSEFDSSAQSVLHHPETEDSYDVSTASVVSISVISVPDTSTSAIPVSDASISALAPGKALAPASASTILPSGNTSVDDFNELSKLHFLSGEDSEEVTTRAKSDSLRPLGPAVDTDFLSIWRSNPIPAAAPRFKNLNVVVPTKLQPLTAPKEVNLVRRSRVLLKQEYDLAMDTFISVLPRGAVLPDISLDSDWGSQMRTWSKSERLVELDSSYISSRKVRRTSSAVRRSVIVPPRHTTPLKIKGSPWKPFSPYREGGMTVRGSGMKTLPSMNSEDVKRILESKKQFTTDEYVKYKDSEMNRHISVKRAPNVTYDEHCASYVDDTSMDYSYGDIIANSSMLYPHIASELARSPSKPKQEVFPNEWNFDFDTEFESIWNRGNQEVSAPSLRLSQKESRGILDKPMPKERVVSTGTDMDIYKEFLDLPSPVTDHFSIPLAIKSNNPFRGPALGLKSPSLDNHGPQKKANPWISAQPFHDTLNDNTMNETSDASVSTEERRKTARSHIEVLGTEPQEIVAQEAKASGAAVEPQASEGSENVERGRLFFRIEGLKNLQLPEIAKHDGTFSVVLDNGIHCIKTPEYKLGAQSAVGQEFELVVGDNLEFILTLKARYEKFRLPLVEVKETVQVKLKHRLSRMMGGKDTMIVTKLVEKKVHDPWLEKIATDGSFARCYIDFEQYEKKVTGKVSTFDITCFNEWETIKNPMSGENLCREPYRIGQLEVKMLYLPRSSPSEVLPSSIKDAIESLRFVKEGVDIRHEGYLYQEGGDCDSWKRRYFKLSGTELIALNEKSKKPRAKINLQKALDVVWVGKANVDTTTVRNFSDMLLVDNCFKLKFNNGEVIDFGADNPEEWREWTGVLEKIVSKNLFRRQSWVKLMQQDQKPE